MILIMLTVQNMVRGQIVSSIYQNIKYYILTYTKLIILDQKFIMYFNKYWTLLRSVDSL